MESKYEEDTIMTDRSNKESDHTETTTKNQSSMSEESITTTDQPIGTIDATNPRTQIISSKPIIPVQPSPTRFEIPPVTQLITNIHLNESAQFEPTPTSTDTLPHPTTKQRGMTDADRWLLLAVTDQLESVKVTHQLPPPPPPPPTASDAASSSEASNRSSSPMEIRDHLYMIQALLGELGARVDAQDESGWSPIHWLIFFALSQPIGSAAIHEDEVKLDGVTRYQVRGEPTLQLLLAAGEKLGYIHTTKRDDDFGVIDLDVQQHDSTHAPVPCGQLLDLQDHAGNTALHYAVLHRRVDIVGLLLCYQPSINIPNKAGVMVKDMIIAPWNTMVKQNSDQKSEVDEEKKEMDIDSSVTAPDSQVHPLLAGFDTWIYSSMSHLVERGWGTQEGLRLEQCSFKDESDSDAIGRLIFQHVLFDAVNADPAGDLNQVKQLVGSWLHEYKSGRKMFPLVYRGDAFHQSPLQVAVSYETEDSAILQQLLKLPWLFHVQSRVKQFAPMHNAVACRNMDAVELLTQAGYNMNHRDIITGQTPLTVLCGLDEDPTHPWIGKFCDRLCSEYGADPLLQNNDGNSALTISVHIGRLPQVRQLSKHISVAQASQWLLTPNRYGNVPIHYAFNRELPINKGDILMLKHLVGLGALVDQPKNLAGLSPLQVFTGIDSPEVSNLAKLVGKANANEIKEAVKSHHRPKVSHATVFNKDVTDGVDHQPPVAMVTEYAIGPSDQLVQFKYVSVNQADPTNERACAFVASKLTRVRPHDQLLQKLFFHVDAEPIPHIPLQSLEVRMTRAKGWGLFAKRNIPMNHGLEVIGEIISEEKAEERDKEYQKKNQFYLLPRYRVYDGVTAFGIDNKSVGNLAHFINHSCERRSANPKDGPNLIQKYADSGRSCMVVTNRVIKAGEELTINYGYERLPRGTIVCACETTGCLGKLIHF